MCCTALRKTVTQKESEWELSCVVLLFQIRWHVKTKCKWGLGAHIKVVQIRTEHIWFSIELSYSRLWLLFHAAQAADHSPPQSSDLSFPLKLFPCQPALPDVSWGLCARCSWASLSLSCALWVPSKGQRACLVVLVLSSVIGGGKLYIWVSWVRKSLFLTSNLCLSISDIYTNNCLCPLKHEKIWSHILLTWVLCGG